jgi:hypothetical protein
MKKLLMFLKGKYQAWRYYRECESNGGDCFFCKWQNKCLLSDFGDDASFLENGNIGE